MTIRRNQFNGKLLEIGRRLRSLRKQKKLTISQFAEVIDLSTKMVSNYENGKNVMTIETIVKIHRRKVFEPKTLGELFEILVISIYED